MIFFERELRELRELHIFLFLINRFYFFICVNSRSKKTPKRKLIINQRITEHHKFCNAVKNKQMKKGFDDIDYLLTRKDLMKKYETERG